jgi:hypothetical protein
MFSAVNLLISQEKLWKPLSQHYPQPHQLIRIFQFSSYPTTLFGALLSGLCYFVTPVEIWSSGFCGMVHNDPTNQGMGENERKGIGLFFYDFL